MTRANPASDTQELKQAQKRAEQLEKELETTRHTIADLKSEQQQERRTNASSDQNRPDRSRRGSENSEDPVHEKSDDPIQQLRQEPMMAHLLDSLQQGKDIGHYGRLVFAMVAHHFLDEEELIAWLTKDRDFSEEAARAMLRQVEGRDYNPPRRERILEWQSEQEFPIIPNSEDPDCGNVYRNLKFPQHVYEDIQDYQEKKAEAAA